MYETPAVDVVGGDVSSGREAPCLRLGVGLPAILGEGGGAAAVPTVVRRQLRGRRVATPICAVATGDNGRRHPRRAAQQVLGGGDAGGGRRTAPRPLSGDDGLVVQLEHRFFTRVEEAPQTSMHCKLNDDAQGTT